MCVRSRTLRTQFSVWFAEIDVTVNITPVFEWETNKINT